MGDGEVACMPLQQQQHIMERFPIPSESHSGGRSNGFKTKSAVKLGETKRKKKIKVKKEDFTAKNAEAGKSELGLEKGDNNSREFENAENGVDSAQKEEVEEGELGTLKWPRGEVENGEFMPIKSRRSEIEVVDEKWRKREIEKGELVPEKWQRGNTEKTDVAAEKNRKSEADKVESRLSRPVKDEIGKGEFIPDRWQNDDVVKEDYSYTKLRRYESGKEKGFNERERFPFSGKYPSDAVLRRKELNGSAQERSRRISSKIVNEEGSYNNEYSNGKILGRDYFSGGRFKRYGTDSGSSERKIYADYVDYAGSKSRRLSEDHIRSANSEHYSHRSAERSYRNSSSSKVSSSEKYSSRNYESSVSSGIVYDRHGHSPSHFERAPRDRDRARYYDRRDRTPVRRDRSPYGRERSPYGTERSPYGRERSPYDRERSPYVREKSPHDRRWNYDRRYQSPHAERSPQGRYHGRRDRTPIYMERSPLDRSRPYNNHREVRRKGGLGEKHNSQNSNGVQEDKIVQRDIDKKGSNTLAKESLDGISVHNNTSGSIETNTGCDSHEVEQPQNPSQNCTESSHVDVVPEELPSMEEDMDICDTPPHVPLVSDTSTGKWFYLDYTGMEQGPSKLFDLKALVEEGALMSDHFIRHLNSNRWVTVENAVSPLVTGFTSIASDSVTQLANPPEASGNILTDVLDSGQLIIPTGNSGQSDIQSGEGTPSTLLKPIIFPDDRASISEPLEDLHIDERVGALLECTTVIPGRELEIVGEALQMTFDDGLWDKLANCEGLTLHRGQFGGLVERADELPTNSDINLKDAAVSKSNALSEDKDCVVDLCEWFSNRWSCKGGDWRRNDEGVQERTSRKKLVLNDGFPLCQMPKSGYEDPRWHEKDDLYYPSQSRQLDLPPWAISCPDERNKPALLRGVKGTMLPVVRINACVVKDQGSFVSDPCMKARGKDRFHSRSSWPQSANGDLKRLSADGNYHSKSIGDQGSEVSRKYISSIDIPNDCVRTTDDLQLHLGDWYYLDGAGHERGPSSFSELQLLVDQDFIKKDSSVFRKFDRIWVPVTSAAESSQLSVKNQQENNMVSGETSALPASSAVTTLCEPIKDSSLFHNLHPQFVGYTRGRLHELIMKSYKSREFAAAINEVLDPWINAKQPNKEREKHIYRKSVNTEGYARAAKRARLLVDESEEDYNMEEDLHTNQKDEPTFDDLCGDATFDSEESADLESQIGSWGLLGGYILARVFHYLRSDMRSLAFASFTCKHWRAAVKFYKDISRQVDFSSLGPNCTDAMFLTIMNGYNKEKVHSIVLVGCTKITSVVLEEILGSFPCLYSVDIKGCSQFDELSDKYPNVNWVKRRTSCGAKYFENGHSKIRSLKQITDKSSISKTKGLTADMDDFGELKQYFESVDKRDSANQVFRRSLYKRSKVFDARRSSSIVSRDARTRRWAIKKSENGYKRMGGFLASGLKDIMKENIFEFFVPKVAEIQDRIKNGYYIGHGLSSVKEDIRRMCRDAIKAKNRGDAGDMNRIITLFIQLAASLEGSFKSSLKKDEMMSWEDEVPAGFGSTTASKYRKKLNRIAKGRKYSNSGIGSSFANGGIDHGEYASDREIRRRLSRLNEKLIDSGSETSEDFDRSSGDGRNDSESTISDTESDLDFQSEGRTGDLRGEGCFSQDESYASTIDDREWGARMTKASLVPPVTRKYEVIDQYLIVAGEKDVRRKMSVSLPDDYGEKLNSQKNGTEELDMELPEVKDYKPRKKLGDEVVEQEVYGIDPYTHNLLLDSMPEELDWPLLDKHVFIEDVLLRTLNKQVRHFTGTGNTPMMFPLQPVIEEIAKAAEGSDIRSMRMCRGILKAIESRPEDKYVAYRKGLGVICNKEGGFGEDDFVVEFLGEVYPAWKWFEKQDGIRYLQKDSNDPAPEFYNIYLERPKGDADGYDLVVVDAMHKANYASRICHSCRPNCEAKVTAVDGHYQIGIYTLREIQYGEEITFDYNSVTESKEEYEASVCLCGSQVCRGSYLNLTGDGAFLKVLEKWHGVLDRYQLMLEACELSSVSEEDYLDLGRAGLGSCLLGGLPDWLIAYSARLVRFINFERTKLPEEILRHNLEEKRKFFSDICLDVEKSDAEVQAEGVYNQRLQNLAVTLDKVRYVMRCIFDDPKKAPPPLRKLSPEDAVSFLWKGEGSLVEELLQCMASHVDEDLLDDLKSKIHSHDPSDSDDIQERLQRSLLWLRDEVRNLPCTYKARHDAAADLIHIYAYTKCFFRIQEYKSITSPPVYISPLDLGPKYSDKLGEGFQEYCKTYGQNYCLGQLIFWYNQSNADPDCSLARASRGCLSLPEMGSFYAKVQKPSRHRVYGPRTVKFMLARMEKQPQRPWPKDQIWSFKSSLKVVGSPMLDSVLSNSSLDREMVHWLKHRPSIFHAMWDR